jgi:hypothetical protein
MTEYVYQQYYKFNNILPLQNTFIKEINFLINCLIYCINKKIINRNLNASGEA